MSSSAINKQVRHKNTIFMMSVIIGSIFVGILLIYLINKYSGLKDLKEEKSMFFELNNEKIQNS